MLRYLTAGESHGPAVTAIVEGIPAGLSLSNNYINYQLKRRQGGYGRGGRMKIEVDRVTFLSGIRGGFTLGTPITLQIENKDWANWSAIMATGEDARLDERVITRPRPGHADLGGAFKYHYRDLRNVLERASARETANRVAVGSIARRLLEELGIEIIGQVVCIGKVVAPEINLSTDQLKEALKVSEVGCADLASSRSMMKEIDLARQAGDSLGGVFEIRAFGLPPGLGSYAQWDRRLDGRLTGALMSIQAIKGVEIGMGFSAARQRGSEVHDEIFYEPGRGFYRQTNRAGGLEGGVTNGEPLIIRAAMKPIPTLTKPLHSVDFITKEPFLASVERSDICAVPAACVVGEAVVAWELAVACLEKFGGDSLIELKDSYERYLLYVRQV